jgi:response regulator RpfG family c-di-GMP phosphodiesterase
MMAVDPQQRYANPDEVKRALLPFLKPESCERFPASSARPGALAPVAPSQQGATVSRAHKVLVVDDEAAIRELCRMSLEGQGIQCDKAANGLEALQALNEKQYDLVLSDIDMPEMTGPELLQRIRSAPPCPHLKVIMFSGRASPDEMAQLLALGADDYLSKPLSLVQFLSRVKAALRLKDAQDRSDLLNRQMLSVNAELERNLNLRDGDLVHARNALVLALAELVSQRGVETGAHLMRLQRFCRYLGEEAACFANFAQQIDGPFIQMLECCVPLHDIGKVALPDHILLKPGKLDADERIMMEAHTVVGAEMLQKVATKHGCGVAFLQMAVDIARHHHERFDGRGYPDRLAGEDIPLAARIVTVADVYDALRSRRSYKPALSHGVAMQVMSEGSPGQFDPLLLEAFQRCAPRFERTFQELPD